LRFAVQSPEESDNEFDHMDAYELGDYSNDEYDTGSGDDSNSENVVFYYEDLRDS
jgi:hypothetical protein